MLPWSSGGSPADGGDRIDACIPVLSTRYCDPGFEMPIGYNRRGD